MVYYIFFFFFFKQPFTNVKTILKLIGSTETEHGLDLTKQNCLLTCVVDYVVREVFGRC